MNGSPAYLQFIVDKKRIRKGKIRIRLPLGRFGSDFLRLVQVMKAAATTWEERRARINTVSPGVIVTPLAYDEFAAAGEGYQKMVDASAAERCGTSEEIAEAGAFLLGEHAGFITGTDLLIDGGVISSIKTGQYKLHR